MQTSFTAAQLADPHIAVADKILRKCVHCGFCLATCPTYQLLGNELDSPRGRIYLIKDMLENDRPADEMIVRHIDRCLTCLACTTTCPSGVDYMHLVDHARHHIEKTYRRPKADRVIRGLLAAILPYPWRFRAALKLAWFGRPFAGLFDRRPALKPLAAMLRLAARRLPGQVPAASGISAETAATAQRGRVAIFTGCVQPVLGPGINAATVRLLGRLGVEVIAPPGEGCCGALVHHMGRHDEALAAARRNVDAWINEIEGQGLDAIIVTASGCGTTIKDYGFMLSHDPAYAGKAARVSALARDVTEYVAGLDLPRPSLPEAMIVAYHSACSLQHGQKIMALPRQLLEKAGFVVREPREGYMCCGSAGVYNILQSEISQKLRDRKVKNIAATGADIVATGNIGCMTQIGDGAGIPIVHTIELLDWAYGGPRPGAQPRN